MYLTLTVTVRGREGREPTQNCCTCYPLPVTFAPAPLLSTWKCINNCVPTCCTDWLLLILWLGLPWQPQRNPLQCILSRVWSAGQVERRLNEDIYSQETNRSTNLHFSSTSVILSSRMNICLKHDFVHMSWTEFVNWGLQALRDKEEPKLLKWSVNNAHNHFSLSLFFPLFLSFHAF